MFACLTAIAMMQTSAPDVDVARLRAIVEKLSSFHTRNTLSPGLVEACEWVASEFRKMPGVEVEIMRYPIAKGRRIPEDMEAVQVIATIPGETDRVLLMGGHIDSLNLEVDAKTGRAPGANDDASGVAATMEVCRLMAAKKWRNTLKFVAFSGEEQGLHGSSALAKRAKDEGWDVIGVLNNDTVGSSGNLLGQKDEGHVRVFSEEGEGHGSRELARYIEWVVRRDVKNFGVKLVFRRDRFGRGGDHTPFVQQGFSAVRFIEVHEEYSRQHTPDDLIEHMDFDYLANVTRANLAVYRDMASGKESPSGIQVERHEEHQALVRWQAEEGVSYQVFWRETTSPVWQGSTLANENGRAVLPVSVDDHLFGVGAIGSVPKVQSS